MRKYITADHGEDDSEASSDDAAASNCSLHDDNSDPSDVDVDEWLSSDLEDDCVPEEVEYDVDDEVDAFYHVDKTTAPRWELAVVTEVNQARQN